MRGAWLVHAPDFLYRVSAIVHIKKVDAGQIRWALPRCIGPGEMICDGTHDTMRMVMSVLIACRARC
ncbi:MAG: hypothetical protein RI985_465 [Chloroflexota bacterium]|jgi:hypothetical protein